MTEENQDKVPSIEHLNIPCQCHQFKSGGTSDVKAVGVCSAITGGAISIAYSKECLEKGIEWYPILLFNCSMILEGVKIECDAEITADDYIKEVFFKRLNEIFSEEIVKNNFEFYEKTQDEFYAEIKAQLEYLENASGIEP